MGMDYGFLPGCRDGMLCLLTGLVAYVAAYCFTADTNEKELWIG